MKIIDFEKKGNQVRFYVGKDETNDYWGDDWNDSPYEHNAGSVYKEYAIGYFDKVFDFDDIVMEPCDGYTNSSWSKEDMKKGLVPCICVLKEKDIDDVYVYKFDDISSNKNVIRYYFNDKVNEKTEKIKYYSSVS